MDNSASHEQDAHYGGRGAVKAGARFVSLGAVAAAAVVISLVVVAPVLTGARRPSPTPDPTQGDSSPTSAPQSPAASSATSSPSSASPTQTEMPNPSPESGGCGVVDETAALALRLEHFDATGRDWVISVFEDGSVLTPGLTPWRQSQSAWMLVRGLTPAGVLEMRNEVLATGLFDSSGSYHLVLRPGQEHPGWDPSGYAITLGSGQTQVDVGWTTVPPYFEQYYEPSAERDRLELLAARMLAWDSWLSDDGWAIREPCTYQAARFRIWIEAQAYGGSLADLAADIADVTWPLGGAILEWGTNVTHNPNDPTYVERCGIVARAEAASLIEDLLAAGASYGYSGASELDSREVHLALGDRAMVRIVQIKIRPIFPDDDGGCSAEDRPWGL